MRFTHLIKTSINFVWVYISSSLFYPFSYVFQMLWSLSILDKAHLSVFLQGRSTSTSTFDLGADRRSVKLYSTLASLRPDFGADSAQMRQTDIAHIETQKVHNHSYINNYIYICIPVHVYMNSSDRVSELCMKSAWHVGSNIRMIVVLSVQKCKFQLLSCLHHLVSTLVECCPCARCTVGWRVQQGYFKLVWDACSIIVTLPLRWNSDAAPKLRVASSWKKTCKCFQEDPICNNGLLYTASFSHNTLHDSLTHLPPLLVQATCAFQSVWMDAFNLA